MFNYEIIGNYLSKSLSDEARNDVEKVLQMKLSLEDYRWTQGHRKGLEDAVVLIKKGLRVLFEGEKAEKEDHSGSSKIKENEWDSTSIL